MTLPRMSRRHARPVDHPAAVVSRPRPRLRRDPDGRAGPEFRDVVAVGSALLLLLSDPARLSAMSAGARSAALPDATRALADMVEAAA